MDYFVAHTARVASFDTGYVVGYDTYENGMCYYYTEVDDERYFVAFDDVDYSELIERIKFINEGM